MVDKLLEENRELKEELQQRIEDNANMYATLCDTLTQLREANKVLVGLIAPQTPSLEPVTEYLEKWKVKDDTI